MRKALDPGPQEPRAASPHAVERYQERHRPGLSIDEAQAELARELRCAVLVEDVPRERQAIYAIAGGRFERVLVVVDRDGIVRTCLPRGTKKQNGRWPGRTT